MVLRNLHNLTQRVIGIVISVNGIWNENRWSIDRVFFVVAVMHLFCIQFLTNNSATLPWSIIFCSSQITTIRIIIFLVHWTIYFICNSNNYQWMRAKIKGMVSIHELNQNTIFSKKKKKNTNAHQRFSIQIFLQKKKHSPLTINCLTLSNHKLINSHHSKNKSSTNHFFCTRVKFIIKSNINTCSSK